MIIVMFQQKVANENAPFRDEGSANVDLIRPALKTLDDYALAFSRADEGFIEEAA